MENSSPTPDAKGGFEVTGILSLDPGQKKSPVRIYELKFPDKTSLHFMGFADLMDFSTGAAITGKFYNDWEKLLKLGDTIEFTVFFTLDKVGKIGVQFFDRDHVLLGFIEGQNGNPMDISWNGKGKFEKGPGTK